VLSKAVWNSGCSWCSLAIHTLQEWLGRNSVLPCFLCAMLADVWSLAPCWVSTLIASSCYCWIGLGWCSPQRVEAGFWLFLLWLSSRHVLGSPLWCCCCYMQDILFLALIAGELFASVGFLDVWLLSLHEGCSCYLYVGSYSLSFIVCWMPYGFCY